MELLAVVTEHGIRSIMSRNTLLGSILEVFPQPRAPENDDCLFQPYEDSVFHGPDLPRYLTMHSIRSTQIAKEEDKRFLDENISLRFLKLHLAWA